MEVVGDDTFSYSVACWCGIALSVYALWVEVQKHRNPQYVAICDLGDNMKCSRVLTSQSVFDNQFTSRLGRCSWLSEVTGSGLV